jgi:hypothetical protein
LDAQSVPPGPFCRVGTARSIAEHLRYPPDVTVGPTLLLAHQGGWDEILMVAVPVLVFGLLLRAANRRAQRQRDGQDAPPPEGPANDAGRRGPI